MANDDDFTAKTMVFTDRQVEVIAAWANSGSIAKAAKELGIRESTFQTHLKRLRARLKVHRTVDVYLYMLRKNYLKNT